MGMQDTSPEAAAYQADIHRRMTPEERFELAWEMSLMSREFCLAGIRQRNPGHSENQVMQAYIRDVLHFEIPKSSC